ncbi:MAG: CBASS oligonucleotide cyclase [bacterium]|nr:CBASS oligonucleotide cyclase [bacterium]
MSVIHVGHSEIVRFADERVNLKRDDAKVFRDQINRLRDRLEQHLSEHPDFALKKMFLSGSLAKGTALKLINDGDVAVYVSSGDAPSDTQQLIPWLAQRLRQAFPNIKPGQVVENPSTLTVSFIETGLRVDVVPVLYSGDPNWKGYIVSKHTGEKVLTSIPMHIDFTRRRKAANEIHFAQVVRLMKFWVRNQRLENPEFRFKSFMIELLVAHLADRGLLQLDDYPEALAQIFAHIAKDSFKSTIAFGDHYDPKLCAETSHPIRIWDPINHQNNTASRYTDAQRKTIIEFALDAGDAIDSALHATTKADTLRYWRKVLGSTFDA